MKGLAIIVLLTIGATANRTHKEHVMQKGGFLQVKYEGPDSPLDPFNLFDPSEAGEGEETERNFPNIYQSDNEEGRLLIDFTPEEDGGAFLINSGLGEYTAVYNGEDEGKMIIDVTPGVEGGAKEVDTSLIVEDSFLETTSLHGTKS